MTDPGRVPLGSRAWIGDGTTGALVAADGTIDWYCPTAFAGPGALTRLVDPAGGALRVGPLRTGTGVTRRLPPGIQSYRPGTMVVETETASGGGRVVVTDLMPWAGAAVKAPGRVVRIATVLAGPVDVEVEVIPGWNWGAARRVSSWSEGLVADGMAVRCGFPLTPEPLGRDMPRWRGVQRLDAGESLVVTIDDAADDAHRPLSVDAARRLADDTAVAWRSWLARSVYGGGYPDIVERSALAVRSLSSTSTGAQLAAGTTSLPRVAGGERNDDARLVRWRDAAAAARVLARIGLNEDAEAAERWLRQAMERQAGELSWSERSEAGSSSWAGSSSRAGSSAAGPARSPAERSSDGGPVSTQPSGAQPWPAVLDIDGGPVEELSELPLAGWRRSQPVVVGALPGLVDLDAYGDVLTAVSASRRGPSGEGGAGPLTGVLPLLDAAADWVADHWSRPEGGLWSSTGPPVRLVASAVQAWVALDATVRRAVAANPLDLAAAGWRQEAGRVLRWLESDGLAADGGLRRSPSPADHPDAALLRVAWRGPWPPEHPIVKRTVDRILEQLANGLLVHRLPAEVDDGRSGTDSPDLLASLWAARALAALGRWEEAHERFEAVVGLGGELGLLSDAADPLSGELLGNLPAAGVHLAAIDTAVALTAGPR
jgi:GH15 family glucan-1,4-alpha-glucosidase